MTVRLWLSPQFKKLHPVFHVSKMKSIICSPLQPQTYAPPSPRLFEVLPGLWSRGEMMNNGSWRAVPRSHWPVPSASWWVVRGWQEAFLRRRFCHGSGCVTGPFLLFFMVLSFCAACALSNLRDLLVLSEQLQADYPHLSLFPLTLFIPSCVYPLTVSWSPFMLHFRFMFCDPTHVVLLLWLACLLLVLRIQRRRVCSKAISLAGLGLVIWWSTCWHFL